jgi:hypothetical protein
VNVSDAWDDAEESAKNAGVGGDFLKMQPGESAVIAVLGKPQAYTAKPFEGRVGSKPSQKVLLSVFNCTTKGLQIWDMSSMKFNGLLEVTGKPSKPGRFPIDRWTYTVKRTGTGTKTRYSILPDKELNDVQKKHLAGLEFPDLGKIADKIEYTSDDEAAVDLGNGHQQAQHAAPAEDPGIPF